jgi:ketosteroid isomerase-like protein
MTAAEMASALDEVQAKQAGEYLIAEWHHGIDSRDLDRALAAWHPQGVLSFTPGPVLDGRDAIRAFLEKTWAAYPEMYHWITNLSLTVHGDSTMHGECRITALCVRPSGTSIREVGTSVLDYTRTHGTWLLSREAATIQRLEPAT